MKWNCFMRSSPTDDHDSHFGIFISGLSSTYMYIVLYYTCQNYSPITYTVVHAPFSSCYILQTQSPRAELWNPEIVFIDLLHFFSFASYIFSSKEEFSKTAVWPLCPHESKSLREVSSWEGYVNCTKKYLQWPFAFH